MERANELHNYQTKSRLTAQSPTIGHSVIYPTLGLLNEENKLADELQIG